MAVITGGSRGIGLEAVKVMLKLNMHLIIGNPNPVSPGALLQALHGILLNEFV